MPGRVPGVYGQCAETSCKLAEWCQSAGQPHSKRVIQTLSHLFSPHLSTRQPLNAMLIKYHYSLDHLWLGSFSEVVFIDLLGCLLCCTCLLVTPFTTTALQCAYHLPEEAFTHRHEHGPDWEESPEAPGGHRKVSTLRCSSGTRLLKAAAEVIEDDF